MPAIGLVVGRFLGRVVAKNVPAFFKGFSTAAYEIVARNVATTFVLARNKIKTWARTYTTKAKSQLMGNKLGVFLGVTSLGATVYAVYDSIRWDEVSPEKQAELVNSARLLAKSPAMAEIASAFIGSVNESNSDVIANNCNDLIRKLSERSDVLRNFFSELTDISGFRSLVAASLLLSKQFSEALIELEEANELSETDLKYAAMILSLGATIASEVKDVITVDDESRNAVSSPSANSDLSQTLSTSSTGCGHISEELIYDIKRLERMLGVTGFDAYGKSKLAETVRLIQSISPESIEEYTRLKARL